MPPETAGASEQPPPAKVLGPGKPLRMLALDGGGIRGVITAVWLEKLEEWLGEYAKGSVQIRDYFHLIAGTSTGSILAAGLGHGKTPKQIIEMYRDQGPTVFPPSRWRDISRWGEFFRRPGANVLLPKFDGRGLDQVLNQVFDGATFGNIAPTKSGTPLRLLVVSYDAFIGMPVIFKSHNPKFKDYATVDIVRASCSAPTYFPAKQINFGHNDDPLIDGGMAANNPAVCALAEVSCLRKLLTGNPEDTDEAVPVSLEDVVIASFGTGHMTNRVTLRNGEWMGTVPWVSGPLMNTMFTGSSEVTNYLLNKLLGQNNFLRFDMQLDSKYMPMDLGDKRQINELIGLARDAVLRGDMAEKLDGLARNLAKWGPV